MITPYRECKNIETSLLRHIQTAVGEKQIEFMVDDDKDLIEDDAPEVLDHFFTAFGNVTAEEVKKLENSCQNISHNPANRMITIFHPIKQLLKKAREAGIPFSDAQLLKFGLSLIRNTRDSKNLWEN